LNFSEAATQDCCWHIDKILSVDGLEDHYICVCRILYCVCMRYFVIHSGCCVELNCIEENRKMAPLGYTKINFIFNLCIGTFDMVHLGICNTVAGVEAQVHCTRMEESQFGSCRAAAGLWTGPEIANEDACWEPGCLTRLRPKKKKKKRRPATSYIVGKVSYDRGRGCIAMNLVSQPTRLGYKWKWAVYSLIALMV